MKLSCLEISRTVCGEPTVRAIYHPEPAQLRDLRVELQNDPALCERTLAVLGEPTPESERGLIRTDSESVDLALARVLAWPSDRSPSSSKESIAESHLAGKVSTRLLRP